MCFIICVAILLLLLWNAAFTSSKEVMIKPVKHDKRAKHKKNKGLAANIAVHPFVLAGIIAAIALVVWGILFNCMRLINR
jgi:hypothetical protein